MNSETIKLLRPWKRGDQDITEIVLRRPAGAGELRGIKMMNVHMGDVDTILTLTRRLSMTPLSDADIDTIDSADLTQLTARIMGFF